jgi:hypothetical protein
VHQLDGNVDVEVEDEKKILRETMGAEKPSRPSIECKPEFAFSPSIEAYAARAVPLGAGEPCSSPCVLRSSSTSGQ